MPSHTVIHRGRVEVTLTSYGLKDDEIDRLHRFHESHESARAMSVEGELDIGVLSSLIARAEAIVREPEEKSAERSVGDINSFVALYEFFRSLFSSQSPRSDPGTETFASKEPEEDSRWEKVARSIAFLRGRDVCAAYFTEAKAFLVQGFCMRTPGCGSRANDTTVRSPRAGSTARTHARPATSAGTEPAPRPPPAWCRSHPYRQMNCAACPRGWPNT